MRESHIDYVRERLAAASGAMEFEPDIMMDLSQIEFGSLPVVLAALIGRGNRNEDEIRAFLASRNCRYEWEMVELVLDHFEGRNRKSCLWSVDNAGTYRLIVKPWTKFDREWAAPRSTIYREPKF
ncbi:hypothetical protein [Sphingopyxis sp.]|jgi:hypothetical protein|uniref:hypothetical protein n=1 Tax=Sphingopyxis sp. TaxID=1908224 RepID=UPI00311DBD80